MKVVVWIVSTVVVLGSLAVYILSKPVPKTPITLLQCIDTSLSSNDKLSAFYKDWCLRLYSLFDPLANLTLCLLTNENVPVVYMRKGLPEADFVSSGSIEDLFKAGTERGTRPLKFLEYALSEANECPEMTFAVIFFTDGENDYQEDNNGLKLVCEALVAQPNIIKVGMLGSNPLGKKGGADWSNLFPRSDKVIIRTNELDCTEQGIDQFCAEVEESRKAIAQSNMKGQ